MPRFNIRWRLTLWFGGAIGAVLVLRSVWIYGMMESRLVARTDAALNAELDSLIARVQKAENESTLRDLVQQHIAEIPEWKIQVTRGPDNVVYETPERPGPATSASHPPPRRHYRTEVTDGDHRRVAIEEIATPGGTFTVQVSQSIGAREEEAWDFVLILFTTLPLVGLAAVGVGYFVSGRALKPVADITAAAMQISAEQLDKRITVPDTGDELARLAETFNDMIDRLRHAFDEMRRFTADAAHDLRTPVTALRTEVEVGLMINKTVEDYRESLESVLAEAVNLSRLTDQLLDLCREDHGIHPDQNQPVPIASIVNEVVDNLQATMQQKQITYEQQVDETCVAQGDPYRIRRVIMNLLNNAVQYTSTGGRVWVRGHRSKDTVYVEIADNGPGIPAAEVPHIFKRFHRVDKSRNREMGGAGLGLSICKAIVEAHNGVISVESTEGQGTSITVSLPAGMPLPTPDLQWRLM